MKQILIAGFGGQGVLFAGKLLANAGMIEGKEVSWLPSYGPEMRGGTANCSVVISEKQIGSPIAVDPDVLLCFNLPSFDKFEKTVIPGGSIIADSSLIEREKTRDDIHEYRVPATKLAADNNIEGLANMILIGKMIKETGICSRDAVTQALHKSVPMRKKDMTEYNLKAIGIGMEI
ncbi:MAG: 2-oxoacid:acceptor oxidoreductase family protein [Oscillospiraceae bacterium]|nr:2-oxoacid:acceptor oxidoreductase family protein [Oscillospiraceae bacterium]